MTPRPGTFGECEKLPSGRYRARYNAPDGRRYSAPTTFTTKTDARAWLALRQVEIIRNAWQPPEAAAKPQPKLTFAVYAEDWMRHRDVKQRTREHYRKLLDDKLLPAFGNLPLASITADDVRGWYAKLDPKKPTLRSHAYGLLRTILGTAAGDGKIGANPCTIRGAGSTKRVKQIRPATLDELDTITEAMPEQYRAMVQLAGWCALRFGELTELRRRDIVLISVPAESDDEEPTVRAVVRVERAVIRTDDGFVVTTPKSEAGVRDVAVPPHLVPMLQRHLDAYAPKRDDLLFPAAHGGHLAAATLYRRFYTARAVAGRPDLRWHDLRHSGAVLAAQAGATLAELMGRLGHTTPAAAMRYQHAAQERDRLIAERLSEMAGER